MARTFQLIEIASTSVARAVPIPDPAVAGAGAEILVKDTSGAAGTNAITVTPDAGLIDDAASAVISSNNGHLLLFSDGVKWLVKSKSAGAANVDNTNILPLTVTAAPDHSLTVRAVAFGTGFLDANVVDAGTGVGKTITASANGALSCDGVTMAVGNRVLFIGPLTTGTNSERRRRGTYVVTATGDASNKWVLTRTTDWDEPADASRVTYVTATEGTVYGVAGNFWYCDNSAAAVVFGSTRFTFTPVDPNGSVTATKLAAGNGSGVVGALAVKGVLSGFGGVKFKDASTATLVGATTTVLTNQVAATSHVQLQRVSQGAAPGHLSVENIVAGVSFDIVSSSGTDSGDIKWIVVN